MIILLFKKPFLQLFTLVLVSLLPLLPYVLNFYKLTISSNPIEWGNFGDYFSGTVGTLITLIALWYVSRTYSNQVISNYKSGFEATLFKMIEFHHKLIDGLLTDNGNNLVTGRRVLEYFYGEIRTEIRDNYLKILDYKTIKDDEISRKINEIYSTHYDKKLHAIGHYFRHLYHIFKYIHNSKLEPIEKQNYAKIMRAQFSGREIVLIGINCLSIYGVKFKELVEEYAILHRLMNDELFRAAFVKCYKSKAFGNEDITKSLPYTKELTDLYYK